MLDHIQAAAPATASNSSTAPSARVLFNSGTAPFRWRRMMSFPINFAFFRSLIGFCGYCESQISYAPAWRANCVRLRDSRRLDVLWGAFRRAPVLQVFFQNYGCSHSVHGGSCGLVSAFGARFHIMQNSSGLLFEQALRFPAG